MLSGKPRLERSRAGHRALFARRGIGHVSLVTFFRKESYPPAGAGPGSGLELRVKANVMGKLWSDGVNSAQCPLFIALYDFVDFMLGFLPFSKALRNVGGGVTYEVFD